MFVVRGRNFDVSPKFCKLSAMVTTSETEPSRFCCHSLLFVTIESKHLLLP